jgi:hypothetical protein
MPRFSDAALDQHDIDSITRYVLAVRSHPDDRGGWSLGHLGPIPEGMVAWLIGIAALLAVARAVGEREPGAVSGSCCPPGSRRTRNRTQMPSRPLRSGNWCAAPRPHPGVSWQWR